MFWKIVETGLYVAAIGSLVFAATPAELVVATLVAGFGSMTYGRSLKG